MREMKLVAYRDRCGDTIRYDLTVTAKVSLTPDQLLYKGLVQAKLRVKAGLELHIESQDEWHDELRRLIEEHKVVRVEGAESVR